MLEHEKPLPRCGRSGGVKFLVIFGIYCFHGVGHSTLVEMSIPHESASHGLILKMSGITLQSPFPHGPISMDSPSWLLYQWCQKHSWSGGNPTDSSGSSVRPSKVSRTRMHLSWYDGCRWDGRHIYRSPSLDPFELHCRKDKYCTWIERDSHQKVSVSSCSEFGIFLIFYGHGPIFCAFIFQYGEDIILGLMATGATQDTLAWGKIILL